MQYLRIEEENIFLEIIIVKVVNGWPLVLPAPKLQKHHSRNRCTPLRFLQITSLFMLGVTCQNYWDFREELLPKSMHN